MVVVGTVAVCVVVIVGTLVVYEVAVVVEVTEVGKSADVEVVVFAG